MRPSFSSTNFWLGAGVLVLVLAGLVGVATWPRGVEMVEDDAALMTEEQRARIAEHHGYLLLDHDIDYRIITAKEQGDINRFAVARFDDMGVGEASTSGRGLLLVIDPGQDQVRLEVGYALEGVYPDAFIAFVEYRQMVPFFRAGRVADGILATTELIISRAQRAAANAGFEGEAWMAGSGGAGATTAANIGEGWTNQAGTQASSAGPPTGLGATPEVTLARYLGAMEERNGDPGLALYTAETRSMLQGWVMTPAQMSNVAGTYRDCSAERAKIDGLGGLAVIRYPVSQRQCAPWFFRRVGGGWALDLTMMQSAIRFGRSNAWHFDLSAGHPYDFAFVDWRFDGQGFPISD